MHTRPTFQYRFAGEAKILLALLPDELVEKMKRLSKAAPPNRFKARWGDTRDGSTASAPENAPKCLYSSGSELFRSANAKPQGSFRLLKHIGERFLGAQEPP